MRSFFVKVDSAAAPPDSTVLEAGSNLITGENDFEQLFGDPSSLERDLLLISSSIFAADRAYLRGEREDICRAIELSIPVVNYARLQPLIRVVETALYRLSRLSNDAWRIVLRQHMGTLEPKASAPQNNGITLLFSGGLDSLAAAIAYGRSPNILQLVSHVTRNRITDKSQQELYKLLTASGYKLVHRRCFVSSRSGGPTDVKHDEENTQRTRSFVYLVLGALMARRSGHTQLIYLAENGQMAIHLPLTHGRVGAFSTHTAHPEVLASMTEFLRGALEFDIEIVNPFVHLTKREVVDLVRATLPQAIPIANSCWRNSRLLAGVTHCGECIPCFIRRIAVEFSGVDPTSYNRDPWNDDPASMSEDDIARRNLADLAELVKKFEVSNDEEIMSEWPELFAPTINATEVVALYRRFSYEARTVLSRYPRLTPLLS